MKYLLFIVFINIVIFAQDISVQKGDSLYSSDKPFEAITEYKRAIFFGEVDPLLYEKIGFAYKSGAKYSDAIQYFILSENYEQIVRCNILRGAYSNARNNAANIKNDSIKTYWIAWSYLLEGNLNLAEIEFNKINNKYLADHCRSSYKKLKSENLAKILSVFIPGAGQIYAEEYVSGLLSLAWIGGIGYFTGSAIREERILDALYIVNLLGLRFYRGNLENAENFVSEYNVEVMTELKNSILSERRVQLP